MNREREIESNLKNLLRNIREQISEYAYSWFTKFKRPIGFLDEEERLIYYQVIDSNLESEM